MKRLCLICAPSCLKMAAMHQKKGLHRKPTVMCRQRVAVNEERNHRARITNGGKWWHGQWWCGQWRCGEWWWCGKVPFWPWGADQGHDQYIKMSSVAFYSRGRGCTDWGVEGTWFRGKDQDAEDRRDEIACKRGEADGRVVWYSDWWDGGWIVCENDVPFCSECLRLNFRSGCYGNGHAFLLVMVSISLVMIQNRSY